jgi:hypothetical protein
MQIDPVARATLSGSTAGLAGGQTISGFAPGDKIILSGVNETIVGFANGTLSLTGTAPLELLLPGTFTKPFYATPVATNTDITLGCFAAGTRILTALGEVRVEELGVGDRVLALSGRLARIVWLGWTQARGVSSVRVRAGAFGDALPARDLVLSPDHAGPIDGVPVPVRHLLNGRTIVQEPVAEIIYHHVELAAHDIVLADGLPCESYLDTGNRAAFMGRDAMAPGSAGMQMHGEESRGWPQQVLP